MSTLSSSLRHQRETSAIIERQIADASRAVFELTSVPLPSGF
jgi:hypothetical protein